MTDIVERLEAHMGKAEIQDVLPDYREAAAEIRRLRTALEPFAAEKMPALRRTKIDYDRYGLRRCISPMEIACRDAVRAISSSNGETP